MLDDEDFEALQALLSAERGDWPFLLDTIGEHLAAGAQLRVSFEGGDKDAVLHKAAGLREAFEKEAVVAHTTDPKQRLQESLDIGSILHAVQVLAEIYKPLAALGAAIKFGGPLIQQAGSAALKVLRAHSRQFSQVELQELVVLAVVNEWLDGRYGVGNWAMDLTKIQHKPIANAHVVDLVETRSGTGHRLAISTQDLQPREIVVRVLPATARSQTHPSDGSSAVAQQIRRGLVRFEEGGGYSISGCGLASRSRYRQGSQSSGWALTSARFRSKAA